MMEQETYSVGYDDLTLDFFSRRWAQTHAAFFLPHLRSGMNLLDCGCGPGTLTLSLAEIVAPAQVVGIDIDEEQFGPAKGLASQRCIANVRFEQANLYQIPFSDETFDAAFSHGVLEHLQNPTAALREIRRVLKPDGVLGIRHADFGGFLLEPAMPPLDQFSTLFEQLMLHNGGDPQAGRHQLAWLRQAGFSTAHVSASYDCWTSTPGEARRNAQFLANLVGNSAFGTQLVEAKLTTPKTLAQMSQAFLKWGENPHAFAAEAWGEAVAWR